MGCRYVPTTDATDDVPLIVPSSDTVIEQIGAPNARSSTWSRSALRSPDAMALSIQSSVLQRSRERDRGLHLFYLSIVLFCSLFVRSTYIESENRVPPLPD